MTVKNGTGSSGSVSSHAVSCPRDATSTCAAASVAPPETKKSATVPTAPSRDMSKLELVAELNTRLAKLTDVAASNMSLRLPSATRTNGAERQTLSHAAARCSKDTVSSSQPVLKTPAKSGDRNGPMAKQRNSTLTAGTGASRPNTTPSSLDNKNSNMPQQARPAADTQVSSWLVYISLKILLICYRDVVVWRTGGDGLGNTIGRTSDFSS